MLFLASLLLACSASAEVSRVEAWKAGIKALRSFDAPDIDFGGVVLIGNKDKVLFNHARGYSNIENRTKMRADSVLRLGSISKQYTAASVLQLLESGKIKSLDDKISQYLTDVPFADDITIKQILQHTAGVPNYTNQDWAENRRYRVDWTSQDMYDHAFKGNATSLNFEPGTSFEYSNTGYIIASDLIEKVSGKKWYKYVEEDLLAPLDVKSTRFGSNYLLLPKMASGYSLNVNNETIPADFISMTQPQGAGALVSNAADVMKWIRALHTGKVLSKESYEAMTTYYDLPGSRKYGLGIYETEYSGFTGIGHGGGINGFRSSSAYFPSEEVTVVILVNSESQLDSSSLLSGIAKDLFSKS